MINLILDALLGWLIDFVQLIFDGLFGANLSDMFANFANPTALSNQIPYVDVLSNAMKAIGWVFLAINAYAIIIKALIAQFGGDGSTENPIKSMAKVLIAGFFIANQGSVMSIVSILFGRISAVMPGHMVAINNLSWWFSTDPGKVFTRIMLIVMVAYAAIGAALAYIERLFSYVIFLYTYPIAVAFSINKETSDTFRQWLQGIISQMIMIVLSTGMMYIAITLLNAAMGDIVPAVGEAMDSPIGNLNIFAYILSINAMALVKNSEKILNMYNIRTMPNSDTAAGFGNAFRSAMVMGGTALRTTIGAAKGIGAAAGEISSIGAAAPISGGTALASVGNLVNPMGATQDISPSDGVANNVARAATNTKISQAQGQDYATRVAQPQGVAGVTKDSSPADRLSVAMAQTPSNAQKMQEFHDRNMDHQGGNVRTTAGKLYQHGNDIENFKNFSDGTDAAIKDINESRGKVNDWLNQQEGNTEVQNGIAQAKGENLKADDVYKAYGMANDQSLKNFKPEGYAAPVFKDGKMSGIMMKGQQTNSRTGEVSNKNLYVSTDDVQKSGGAIGEQGEWTANTNGFHQVTPNAFVYDLTPTKSGGSSDKNSASVASEQTEARTHADNLMSYGSGGGHATGDTYSNRSSYGAGTYTHDTHMPEQPDIRHVQMDLNNQPTPDEDPSTPYGASNEASEVRTNVADAQTEAKNDVKGENKAIENDTHKPTD